MVQILNGELIKEDITSQARGGTELIAEGMIKYVDPDLLKKYQIIHSRVRNLDPNKKRIFVAHDLPGDPESNFLANGGFNQFEKLVFVSNWQMQKYIEYYSIPWYKCAVINNAIDPLGFRNPKDENDPIKLVYHTTPHRGLDILSQVFDKISEQDKNVTLDVYSSFSLYGWKEQDEHFKSIFDALKANPAITYHGAIPHEELIEKLPTYDIFAYPSTWPETSCISLLEAMSAGLICVHSNYAALFETSMGLTEMYQYQDNKRDHAKIFGSTLLKVIDVFRGAPEMIEDATLFQSTIINAKHSWSYIASRWNDLLRNI